jgi:mitochondrial fission protein ELM1
MDNECTLRLWCLMDGKPGHQNQTLGLVDALRRVGRANLAVREIPVPHQFPHRFFGPQWNRHAVGPAPHLIIGAGHATHFSMLAAKYRFGGRAIVLMKPSLPMQLFDLCVIPDSHRIRPNHPKVFVTRGVLNRIRYSQRREAGRGLILLGGPSAHFHWDSDRVFDQLHQVIHLQPNRKWTIATSRRTPDSLLQRCRDQPLDARLVEHADVGREWLPAEIEASESIWVTEDSVSMTYEAVTSGASVGTFQLARNRQTRVTLGMDRLTEAGCVTPWSVWRETGKLSAARLALNEAERTAEEIVRRFVGQFSGPSHTANDLPLARSAG